MLLVIASRASAAFLGWQRWCCCSAARPNTVAQLSHTSSVAGSLAAVRISPRATLSTSLMHFLKIFWTKTKRKIKSSRPAACTQGDPTWWTPQRELWSCREGLLGSLPPPPSVVRLPKTITSIVNTGTVEMSYESVTPAESLFFVHRHINLTSSRLATQNKVVACVWISEPHFSSFLRFKMRL